MKNNNNPSDIFEKIRPLLDELTNTTGLKIIEMYNALSSYMTHYKKDIKCPLIQSAPAARKRHHAYEGGLFQHMREMYDFANLTYHEGNFSFSFEDVCVCMYLYDRVVSRCG